MRVRLLAVSVGAVCLVLGAHARGEGAEGELPCADEEALAHAAAELLLAGGPPAPETLDRVVRDAGSDAVGVRALYLPAEDAARERAWVERIQRRADAPTVCGRAVGTSGVLVVVAQRGGSLEEIGAESTHVRGALADGFTDAEIAVSDANGELQRLPVDRETLAEGIAIAEDLARPARVQLVARGASGPRPLAERTIPARGAASGVVDADADPVAVGTPIASQLASLRAAEGRPPVRENRLLAAVASAHATRVCAEDRVAHELGNGDPKQRLRAAGIEARVVGETVASARGDDAAFAAMRHSPSHRMTLLDARFTHVGLGAAKGAHGRACLVALFAAWPRYAGH